MYDNKPEFQPKDAEAKGIPVAYDANQSYEDTHVEVRRPQTEFSDAVDRFSNYGNDTDHVSDESPDIEVGGAPESLPPRLQYNKARIAGVGGALLAAAAIGIAGKSIGTAVFDKVPNTEQTDNAAKQNLVDSGFDATKTPR